MSHFLEVENLNITFNTRRGDLNAIRNLSFHLAKGESLGIAGESGCGKSITSKTLLGLLPLQAKMTASKMNYDGISLLSANEKKWQEVRGKKIAMIFQNPMTALNPSFTVEYQMMETLMTSGLYTKKQAKEETLRLLNQVGIPDAKSRLNVYPHQLSGGMCQRIMIAMSISLKPDLLIADEPTTALDVTIQAQILALLKKLQEEEKMSLILITHDLGVVSHMTDKLMVMYAGEKIEYGKTSDIIKNPRHPYTHGLLKSLPANHHINEKLYTIEGRVPDLVNRAQGCQFAPRCAYAQQECLQSPLVFKEPNLSCLYPLEKGNLS